MHQIMVRYFILFIFFIGSSKHNAWGILGRGNYELQCLRAHREILGKHSLVYKVCFHNTLKVLILPNEDNTLFSRWNILFEISLALMHNVSLATI